jgi:hypothetical protein
MRAQHSSRARAGTAVLALTVMLGGVRAAAADIPSLAAQAGSGGPAASEKGDRLTLGRAGGEFLRDAGRIWSSPARLRGTDVLPLVGMAAATGLLIAADGSIRDHVHDYADGHPWVGDVSSVVTQMGGIGGFLTAGAFFGAGLVFRDTRARDTGYLAANAILQCVLVDNVLKGLSGRQRPFVDGRDRWSGPVGFVRMFDKDESSSCTSFPSGHAASAFSLATVVAMQYRRSGWVPVVAYALAGGVGLSRVGLDKHWASDVFAGAVIGHLIGRLVVRNHGRRGPLVPMAACTGRGFAVGLFYDPYD